MQCKHLLKGVTVAEMFKDQTEDRHLCNKDGSEGGYIEHSFYLEYCVNHNHVNCHYYKHLDNKCENLSICMMTDINEQQPADLSKAKYKHICKKVEGRVGYIEDKYYNDYCSKQDNHKNCATFKGEVD